MTDVRDAQTVAYRSDGQLVRRPLSPHLEIYRPQLTSILSIMNRVTGLAISAGTLLMVWWLMAAAAGPDAYSRVQHFIASPIGLFMLFGWTAALFYHFYNGLRHLAWDAGWGFELPRVHLTGWVVIAATLATTTLVWIAGIVVLRSW